MLQLPDTVQMVSKQGVDRGQFPRVLRAKGLLETEKRVGGAVDLRMTDKDMRIGFCAQPDPKGGVRLERCVFVVLGERSLL